MVHVTDNKTENNTTPLTTQSTIYSLIYLSFFSTLLSTLSTTLFNTIVNTIYTTSSYSLLLMGCWFGCLFDYFSEGALGVCCCCEFEGAVVFDWACATVYVLEHCHGCSLLLLMGWCRGWDLNPRKAANSLSQT